ncbi:MAG: hypothetical protein LC647_08480, partial [Beggiatoa sp.]|nr:hypothetical protein [Beggiatoa sp.]
GWTLEGLHKLHHNDDGSLLLTMGNRSAWVYQPDLAGGFRTPSGDFAILTANPDGSFTRTTEEGMRYDFDARGLLTTMADRNGNPTTYAYDTEGRLDRITDPVGLPTSFRYFAGRLQSITDPALRTTRFLHDAEGNLRSITDPDGATRSFTYAPGSHLLTGQTSKRGFPTAYAYDFAGRLTGSILPDATPKSATPRDVAGLIDPTSGEGTEDHPAPPPPLLADLGSTTVDGRGHGTRYETDAFGRTTEERDAAGRMTTDVPLAFSKYLI